MGKSKKFDWKGHDFACSVLDWLAKELKKRNPTKTFRDINQKIREWTDDSV